MNKIKYTALVVIIGGIILSAIYNIYISVPLGILTSVFCLLFCFVFFAWLFNIAIVWAGTGNITDEEEDYFT